MPIDARRLMDSFLEMVAIPSPSFHEAAMARYCAQRLEELGFVVREDGSADVTGSDVGNLIAFRAGSTPGAVAFCAHLDTVVPCEGIEAERATINIEGEGSVDVLRSFGDTILSADDKAGIAAILEGVYSALDGGFALPDIYVLLTTGEEQSLRGSSALEAGVLPKGVPCFVLDADGRPGAIITGAPCHRTLRATFHGKAAHAGVEPEAGNSAVLAAARAIDRMSLGRLDGTTTANVGVISGGAATNIIPDSCVIKGECRSIYEERAQSVQDAMTRACESAATSCDCTVDIDWADDYPSIVFQETDEMICRLKSAMADIGLEPECICTGGGADANSLKAKGIDAITLGIGMTNFHSTSEFIRVQDLEDNARLVHTLIREYAS